MPKVQADSVGRSAQESCTGWRDPGRGATVTSRFTALPIMTVGVPATVSVNGLCPAADEAAHRLRQRREDELAAAAASPA